MDGWMDGWMGEWVNGWMGGWVDGWMEREFPCAGTALAGWHGVSAWSRGFFWGRGLVASFRGACVEFL